MIPNQWDAGSAKVPAGLGFKALATTSSGFAFTLGRADGAVSLEHVAEHVGVLDAATPLPVSADLENGSGPAPEDAAAAVTRAAEAGAVGGSIEDYDAAGRIYERQHAAERVADRRRRRAGVGGRQGAGHGGGGAARRRRLRGAGRSRRAPRVARALTGAPPGLTGGRQRGA